MVTVGDIEGDERLELIAFTSYFPEEVRVGTWPGTGLDGPSQQLLDLSGFRTEQVAVGDSGVPTFVGISEESGERIAHRFEASRYQTVNVRFLPEPTS